MFNSPPAHLSLPTPESGTPAQLSPAPTTLTGTFGSQPTNPSPPVPKSGTVSLITTSAQVRLPAAMPSSCSGTSDTIPTCPTSETGTIPPIAMTALSPSATPGPSRSSALQWPILTGYRLLVIFATFGYGTAKAILASHGKTLMPQTMEWVIGIIVTLV